MTNKLRNKLIEKNITGTKQETKISNWLLEGEEILNFTNLVDFAKQVNCSASSVTRFSKSIGLPSFKHLYFEFYAQEEEINQNDQELKYREAAKEIVSKVNGKIFIFVSRRGKSVGKFLYERLNSGGIDSEYYHESWNISIKDQISKIKRSDTPILITMNGFSNLANKILDQLIVSKNVSKVIVLTATKKIQQKDKKIIHSSLGKIDNSNYNTESFEGYNQSCSRMISLFVDILRELYNRKNNNLY